MPTSPYQQALSPCHIFTPTRVFLIAFASTFTIFASPYGILSGQRPISSAKHIAKSYATSDTVTKLVNPNGSQSWDDSRSITFKLPDSKREWSDERILTIFTRGFFGGWVFTAERCVLRLPVWRSSFVDFPKQGDSAGSALRVSKIEEAGTLQIDVWTAQQISREKLPDVDTVLFGAFQVLDKRLSSAKGEESYIDFGYGMYMSRFAGNHRFSIERLTNGQTGKGVAEDVRLTMSCVTCNPNGERMLTPDWMSKFHDVYAMVLFREGVAEVLR